MLEDRGFYVFLYTGRDLALVAPCVQAAEVRVGKGEEGGYCGRVGGYVVEDGRWEGWFAEGANTR